MSKNWYKPLPNSAPVRYPRRIPKKAVPSYIGENGQVGNWLFYNGAGDVLFDFSGEGNHGEIHGAEWSDEHTASWALEFDYNYVTQPWGNLNQDMTWVVWIKTSESSTEMRFLFSRDETDENMAGFLLNRYDTDQVSWVRQEDGWGTLYNPSYSGVTDGNWHCIIGTYDHSSGDMVLFVDGDQVDSATGATADLTTPGSVWIGTETGRTGDYVGFILRVIIYTRVLSDGKIKAICEETKPLYIG